MALITNISKKLTLLVYIIVITILFTYIPLSLLNDDYFTSPDENSIYYFTKNYKDNPSLINKYNYSFEHTYGAIKPRGSFYVNGDVVPFLPNGMIVFNGLNQVFFTDKFILLYTPFLFSLSSIYFYKLVRMLFNKTVGVISQIEYIILAPFLHLATKPMILDASSFAYFLIGLYYYLTKNYKPKSLILAGLFFGVCIAHNHKYIFLFISFFITELLVFFIKSHKSKYINFLETIKLLSKRYLYTIIGLFPAFIFIASYNFTLYGNPLTDGYLAQADVNKSIGAIKVPVFFLTYEKILHNVSTYFINIFTAVFVIFITLGLLHFVISGYKKYSFVKILYFIYLMFLMFIIFTYFGSIANWGYGINAISASFVRYLLPLYALLLPLFIYFLMKYTNKKVSIFVLLTINVYSVFYFLFSQGGYLSTRNYVNNSKQIRYEILQNTNKEDIIITKYYDKIIFPYRETVDVGALPVIYMDEKPKFQEDKLMGLINYLSKSGKSVHIINDIDQTSYNNIKSSLIKKNFKFTENSLPTGIIMLTIMKSLEVKK